MQGVVPDGVIAKTPGHLFVITGAKNIAVFINVPSLHYQKGADGITVINISFFTIIIVKDLSVGVKNHSRIKVCRLVFQGRAILAGSCEVITITRLVVPSAVECAELVGGLNNPIICL